MQTDFPNCEAISYRFRGSQAIDIFESGSSFLSSYHGNPILEVLRRALAATEQSKLCTALGGRNPVVLGKKQYIVIPAGYAEISLTQGSGLGILSL